MNISHENFKKGRFHSQDFDLNLASIIDCLTVLITFTLASASFLSIGILDAGVSSAGEEAKSEIPPEINLSIELKQDQRIELKIQGKVNKTDTLSFEKLTPYLKELKARWPSLQSATLLAQNRVEYKEVIKTMEELKKSLPLVLLGGF